MAMRASSEGKAARQHKTSAVLLLCTLSFLLGTQMMSFLHVYTTSTYPTCVCREIQATTAADEKCSTGPRDTTNQTKGISSSVEAAGWHQVNVFHGESTYLKKRLKSPRAQWTSQAKQDEIVWNLLGKRKGGYFIDLAANDATFLSNTYMLETNYDWNGLCIEANQQYWWLLASRPKCQVVGAVVGGTTMEQVDFTYKSKVAPLTFRDGGLTGGIVRSDFDNNQTEQDGYLTERRYTVTLSDVFERFHVPNVIDYFSLDVEGAESFVMKDFPFHRYTAQVMTIERPKDDLKDLLDKSGYVFLQTLSTWGETLYAHKSFLSSLDFDSAKVTPPPQLLTTGH